MSRGIITASKNAAILPIEAKATAAVQKSTLIPTALSRSQIRKMIITDTNKTLMIKPRKVVESFELIFLLSSDKWSIAAKNVNVDEPE